MTSECDHLAMTTQIGEFVNERVDGGIYSLSCEARMCLSANRC